MLWSNSIKANPTAPVNSIGINSYFKWFCFRSFFFPRSLSITMICIIFYQVHLKRHRTFRFFFSFQIIWNTSTTVLWYLNKNSIKYHMTLEGDFLSFSFIFSFLFSLSTLLSAKEKNIHIFPYLLFSISHSKWSDNVDF